MGGFKRRSHVSDIISDTILCAWGYQSTLENILMCLEKKQYLSGKNHGMFFAQKCGNLVVRYGQNSTSEEWRILFPNVWLKRKNLVLA